MKNTYKHIPLCTSLSCAQFPALLKFKICTGLTLAQFYTIHKSRICRCLEYANVDMPDKSGK